MNPFFQNSLVTLYNTDALALLPRLTPASFDAVVTDPPYGIRYRSKRRNPRFNTTIVADDSLNALRAALPMLDRLLKPDRHLFVFAAPTMLSQALDAVSAHFHVKGVLVWDKGNAGSRGDCQAGFSQNWEAIIHAAKGRRALNLPRPRTIFRYDWQSSRDPVHPTAKPVPLMEWLIGKSTVPGELVLDPFMGSGVVPAAAARLGRHAVGIEVVRQYCQTSVKRLGG